MSARSDEPAIPASHIPIAQEIIYRALVLPAVKAEFHRVWLRVEGPAPHPADGPLVIYLTHAAWWDAYMLFLISYKVLRGGFKNYIMMEEKQLRPYRFFSWCGAFSINRKRPGDTRRSIAYAARMLRARRDSCLWIFPQGRIVPADRRPLVVYPGIARIVRLAGGATLWPVALRYEFRGEQQPEAFISCGPPHYAPGERDEADLVDEVRSRLTACSDALRDDVLGERLERFEALVRGREGINRMFDGLLALLPGGGAARRG